MTESLQTTPALSQGSTTATDEENCGWDPAEGSSSSPKGDQDSEYIEEQVPSQPPSQPLSQPPNLKGKDHLSDPTEASSSAGKGQNQDRIGEEGLTEEDPEIAAAILASLDPNASHVPEERELQDREVEEREIEEAIHKSLVDLEENKENIQPEWCEGKTAHQFKKNKVPGTSTKSRSVPSSSAKPYTRSMAKAPTKPYSRLTTAEGSMEAGTARVPRPDNERRRQSQQSEARSLPLLQSNNSLPPSADSGDEPNRRSERRRKSKGKGKAPEYS